MQHALKQPNAATLTPQAVIQLQHTIGNQAVQRLLSKHTVQRISDIDIPTAPRTPAAPDSVQTRQLEFITIKLLGRGIEHWWIEIDGTESYGWWPTRAPSSSDDAAWNHGIVGVPGVLNAVGRSDLDGTATTDPHHGESAPESFHPYTVNRSNGLSDDAIRQRIRNFANSFTGDYRVLIGPNCHTFIADMMESVGLTMGRPTSTEPNIP
jgi:hypothetical protein